MSDGPRNPAKCCKAKKKNGQQCKRYSGVGSEYCPFHDPDPSRARAAEAARNKAVTGRAALTEEELGDTPRTVDGLIEVLGQTIQQVRSGMVDHARGKVVADLGKAMLHAMAKRKELQPDMTPETVAAASDEELRAWAEGLRKEDEPS